MNSELFNYICELPVIDCHEHLLYPHQRVEEKTGFYDLLHYIQSDMISSGNIQAKPQNASEFMLGYQSIRSTAYGRMVKIFAKDLYGITEINERTILKLDDQVHSHSANLDCAKKWYTTVFEKMNIKAALSVDDGSFTQDEVIRPIVYLDFFLRRSQIVYFRNKYKNQSNQLEDYITYIMDFLKRNREKGMVAGKFGTPYWHSLEMIEYDERQAKIEYERDSEENPHFESYVFHQILSAFEEMDIPIQFHTGHVEPSAADLTKYQLGWSNPSCFGAYAMQYPRLKFILLHTGFPFQYEYLSLIKNYSNLYADFSWIYIISPTIAGETLIKAIEMIPINKIIGFGGDCIHIEAVYAHLVLARKVIASAFSEMIQNGYLSIETAKYNARKLLYENPRDIYTRIEEGE